MKLARFNLPAPSLANATLGFMLAGCKVQLETQMLGYIPTMKTELSPDGKSLIITVPLASNPPLSSSGKSRILYSSQGFVKPPGLLVDGKQVSVGLNVIAALR